MLVDKLCEKDAVVEKKAQKHYSYKSFVALYYIGRHFVWQFVDLYMTVQVTPLWHVTLYALVNDAVQFLTDVINILILHTSFNYFVIYFPHIIAFN